MTETKIIPEPNQKSNSLAKITRKDEVATFFENPQNLDRLLPYFSGDKNKADKFKQTLMLMAMDDKYQAYTPQNIFRCGLTSAELDLSPQQNLGQIYFVPYFNKKANKKELQVQVGYKGFKTLLERSRKAEKSWPVYTCDKFTFNIEGFHEQVNLIPNFEERKESDGKWVEENLLGVLVMIKDLDLDVVSIKFVQIDKLQQIKNFSKSSGNGPWVDWKIEMYLGKAVKYVISKTSMDEKTALAVEVENKLEILNKGLLPKSEPSAIEKDIAKETGADIIDVQHDEIESQEQSEDNYESPYPPNEG